MKKATPAVLLQREVIVLLNNIGFKAWVNKSNAVWDPNRKIFRKNNTSINGISDVLGIQKGSGRFLAVELKASKGDKLTDEQEVFLKDIVNDGGLSISIHNVNELIHFLFRECPRNYERLDNFTKRNFEKQYLPPKQKFL